MSQGAPHPRMHGISHVTGGPDPIPGLLPPTGDTLDEKILAAGPDAFWKLDESEGDVAYDSSGNEHHLTADPGYTPPLWGQASGPPGASTAKWVDENTRVATTVSDTIPVYNDDFSAGVWVNALVRHTGELIGQGNSFHGGSSTGWNIMIVDLGGGVWKFAVLVDGTPMYANNALDAGSWYFVAVVRDTGDWKLYVDGLLQEETMALDPGTGYGSNTWLGNDAHTGHSSYLQDTLLSYAFIVDRPMSGAELLGLLDGADSSDEAGYVLGLDADGDPFWGPPGVSVEYGDGPADEAPIPVFGTPSGPTSVSGWHLSEHVETCVLYDPTPGRFDVPTMKWMRVPFSSVRFYRSWETSPGTAISAWLPDDRGLSEQAAQGILHVGAGMEGTADAAGSHDLRWWFTPEWPFLDYLKLPNYGDPEGVDAYVRAGRLLNASTGSVLRSSPGSANRRFFEWSFFYSADAIPEWVDGATDNPYPIYPVDAARPLRLPDPYPKLSEAASGAMYAPHKTVEQKANLSVGDNLCLQVWQDSPWLLRFSTDVYRIPYPGLKPDWIKRPYLSVAYRYDPETIDHTTGRLL